MAYIICPDKGLNIAFNNVLVKSRRSVTVLPAKSDKDVMFCLHSYYGLRINKSLVY